MHEKLIEIMTITINHEMVVDYKLSSRDSPGKHGANDDDNTNSPDNASELSKELSQTAPNEHEPSVNYKQIDMSAAHELEPYLENLLLPLVNTWALCLLGVLIITKINDENIEQSLRRTSYLLERTK